MWQRNIRHTQEYLRLGRLTVNRDRTPVKFLLGFTQRVELRPGNERPSSYRA